MISVSSSNLAAVGYDASTQTLRVRFLNNMIYDYSNVPSRLYDGLMSASSHGSYLDTYIKKGGYSYKRIQ